ncbi:MAG: argininosuccinate lyase [Candidatus Desulforudis sp.]|nr:argininosuccinate lyase [Desulforudis sp.]
MTRLWGGRFKKQADALVEEFHSSLSFDRRLYRYDIRGSIAHARMLGRTGIIRAQEAEALVRGLETVLAELDAGRVALSPRDDEDIHSLVERLLVARVGDVGKKLHTARSRNDQVALDLRMYLKHEIVGLRELLTELQRTLLDLAERHTETLMPGYTHLQRAQPVSLAHHLLAYVEMFHRDDGRLADCYRRTDVMPLGAGALAGTVFPIDREFTAAELGFAALAENSLDAVADRDFAVEFCAAAALIMVHLSRFCEELVLWSSAEFGFVEMDDAFATGSSMMPQKKNPDMAELIRGKSGRVFGDLQALLTMLKGLPLAYNKDLQEDKEALFDAVDTVKKCLTVFTPMVRALEFRTAAMDRAARGGFTNATDLADYLVQRGVPFREAHEIVGRVVLYCLEHGKTLEELTMEEYRRFAPGVGEDVFAAVATENCLAARKVRGGPAPATVRDAITRARARL